MNIIRGISRIRKFKKPVVALGVFDGVHLGHRVILSSAVRKAHSIKGTSVALTFWPHPQNEDSLYSLNHRLKLIAELGIDVCVVINFNKNFSRISALDFIKNILLKRLGAHYVYVGSNFRFGKNALGNCKTLEESASRFNFKLKVFRVIKVNNKVISSTYIRSLIREGKLGTAKKLLRHPVSILGTVIKGDSLGRKLGFPTANIDPHHEVMPPQGIYAVRVIFNGRKFSGVCYIGTRPTLRKRRATRIEVNIFNFRENIYGKYLEVQFIKKIRDEAKFASISALSKQIGKDVAIYKNRISRHKATPQDMPI